MKFNTMNDEQFDCLTWVRVPYRRYCDILHIGTEKLPLIILKKKKIHIAQLYVYIWKNSFEYGSVQSYFSYSAATREASILNQRAVGITYN